jgi:predicted nucleic acid-binding protein
MRSSARTEIIGVSDLDTADAWRILEQYSDHDFSFVDATSFSAMRSRSITDVFAFDRHFLTAGFARV